MNRREQGRRDRGQLWLCAMNAWAGLPRVTMLWAIVLVGLVATGCAPTGLTVATGDRGGGVKALLANPYGQPTTEGGFRYPDLGCRATNCDLPNALGREAVQAEAPVFGPDTPVEVRQEELRAWRRVNQQLRTLFVDAAGRFRGFSFAVSKGQPPREVELRLLQYEEALFQYEAAIDQYFDGESGPPRPLDASRPPAPRGTTGDAERRKTGSEERSEAERVERGERPSPETSTSETSTSETSTPETSTPTRPARETPAQDTPVERSTPEPAPKRAAEPAAEPGKESATPKKQVDPEPERATAKDPRPEADTKDPRMEAARAGTA